MITVEKFLDCVRENEARVTHYESGGDGSGDGGCDCIGEIIGALRLAGVGWEGTHGVNWAARNALQEAGPSTIRSVSDLEAGMVVFKSRRPEDQNYKLPDHYKNSGDLTDYYHVGVVMSTSPLRIDHCTKIESKKISGIVSDTALGQWKYYGHMKSVEFGLVIYHNGQLREKELPWAGKSDSQHLPSAEPAQSVLFTAIINADTGCLDGNPGTADCINADTGGTANMRKGPGRKYDILHQIPIGTRVPVYDVRMDGWCQIGYLGKTGYMLGQYLWEEEDDIPVSDDPQQSETGSDTYIMVDRNELLRIRAAIERLLDGGQRNE